MTLLTGSVQFGDLVRYAANHKHYLVVGFESEDRRFAICERPDNEPQVLHRHWLTVLKPARRWKDRPRVNARR